MGKKYVDEDEKKEPVAVSKREVLALLKKHKIDLKRYQIDGLVRARQEFSTSKRGLKFLMMAIKIIALAHKKKGERFKGWGQNYLDFDPFLVEALGFALEIEKGRPSIRRWVEKIEQGTVMGADLEPRDLIMEMIRHGAKMLIKGHVYQ